MTKKLIIGSLFLSRRISVGRVEAGALLVDGPTIYVPYTAEEANVGTMVRKVREDLGSENTFVLKDTTGNRILPSSGTSGMFQNKTKMLYSFLFSSG